MEAAELLPGLPVSFRSPTAVQWRENSPLPPHFLLHAALHFSRLGVFARLVYRTCISWDFIAENFMTTGNEFLFTGRELKGFFLGCCILVILPVNQSSRRGNRLRAATVEGCQQPGVSARRRANFG